MAESANVANNNIVPSPTKFHFPPVPDLEDGKYKDILSFRELMFFCLFTIYIFLISVPLDCRMKISTIIYVEAQRMLTMIYFLEYMTSKIDLT